MERAHLSTIRQRGRAMELADIVEEALKLGLCIQIPAGEHMLEIEALNGVMRARVPPGMWVQWTRADLIQSFINAPIRAGWVFQLQCRIAITKAARQ